ncbi:MAG: alpha/beta hydrolase, partial [Chloroflexi bacterium]|nr:alpha/beta hydrolase [Chloroflexota bacterium]
MCIRDSVLSQADALTDGAFALAGLSYGGIVALEVWRQAPQRVLKLALLNTNPRPASDATRAKQQRFVGMAHLGEFREITTDFLKDVMLHPDHRRDQALRAQVLTMAESIGVQGFVNQVKAQLARPDSMPDLPNITCPTLVLTGREDYVVPLETHAAMVTALPNGHLVVIEHCGHLTTIEQPAETTAALRDWLLNTGLWHTDTKA